MADHSEELIHYGVLGMKWGVRKDPEKAGRRAYKKLEKLDKKVKKAELETLKRERTAVKKMQKADKAILFPKRKSRKASKALKRVNAAHLNTQEKVAKAVRWKRQMDDVFKSVTINNIDDRYISLGEKYANKELDNLMANSTTTASLRSLYDSYK